MYYPTQDFTQTKGIVKYNKFTRHNHVQTKHKRKKPFVEKNETHTHVYTALMCRPI